MESQSNILRTIFSLKEITQYEWELIESRGGDYTVLGISEDNYFDLCDQYMEKLNIKHKINLKAKKLKKYGERVANLTKDLNDLEAIMEYQEILLEMPQRIKKEVDIFPVLCDYYKAYIPIKDISVDKYLNMYLNIPKK